MNNEEHIKRWKEFNETLGNEVWDDGSFNLMWTYEGMIQRAKDDPRFKIYLRKQWQINIAWFFLKFKIKRIERRLDKLLRRC